MHMAKALNEVDVHNYHRDGYVLVKGLLDSDEVGALAQAARIAFSTNTPSGARTGRRNGSAFALEPSHRHDLQDDRAL
jgi:hypothetical protein